MPLNKFIENIGTRAPYDFDAFRISFCVRPKGMNIAM